MTNTTLYIATENSDRTEGKGFTIVTGIFEDPDKAVKSVIGRGAMGIGDGSVYTVDLVDGAYTGNLFKHESMLYGYRQRNGVWGYGYTNESDDPEYIEYLRLSKKFGSL